MPNMSFSSLPYGGIRANFRRGLNRFRPRGDDRTVPQTLTDASAITVSSATPSTDTTAREHTRNAPQSETDLTQYQISESTNLTATPAGDSVPQSSSLPATGTGTAATSTLVLAPGAPSPSEPKAVAPSDLWSKAYQEAVQNMGEDVDITILKGENIAQLFRELEEVDEHATNESLFLRGVKYLNSIQVPLERFKLALDLTAPLTALEPTTATAFGVVKGVTAMAISISSADYEFAKKIGDMLEQISYIDDCDTLGRRGDRLDIHRALVPVYQKLLEFYVSAYEFLSKRNTRLVLAVISDTGALPDIVKDFLKQAEYLQRIVEKATFDIVQDIKTMLYDEKISQWLGRDKLRQQSRYHADLQSLRADLACEFIPEDTKFQDWYQELESQQLAILGDIGSGKSVIMSFLIDELCRRRKHQLPQPLILYHYCQNDETGHALYVFSSLILSLLEQCIGLKKTFFDWYKQDLLTGNFEPSTNVHKLVGFFQETVQELDRPLYLVLDGLDESDPESRTILLESLRSLLPKTSGFKAVLSCRPWVEILNQIDGMPRIDVGADATRDRIIAEKTVETKLASLSTVIKELIVDRLSMFAQGSAIWTKMTVEVIAAHKIRALSRMKKFLDNMPQSRKLSELYTSLFDRCAGEEVEVRNIAATALEILAVSRRRLSIFELAWAVAMGTADPDVLTVAEVGELVDEESVIALIQPFVAGIDFNDLKKPQVILVHQSAKDFVLKDLATRHLELQNVEDRPAVAQNSVTAPILLQLEMKIYSICVRYLLLEEINQVPLFSDEQVAIKELPQDLDLFSDDNDATAYTTDCSWENWEEGMIRYDPADRGFGELFVYASCYWINHFGSSSIESASDLKSVEKLCVANSIRLHNWTSQNSRPDCVVQARFDFDGSLYDPLSITSLYGSEGLLLTMLQTSDFESNNFLPNTAMLAIDQILQWGDLRRVRMLFFGSGTGRYLQNLNFFRFIIKSWRFYNKNFRQDWDAAFSIIDEIPDIIIREGWGNELLCLASGQGCLPVVKRLMKLAEHNADLLEELLRESPRQVQTSTQGFHQSIGEAVLAGHLSVVEYLLQQNGIETHLCYRNANSENVLHLASEQCNPAMFEALAPRFPEGIFQKDFQGRTALMRVAESPCSLQKRLDSARTLLSLGVTHQSMRFTVHQQEALQIAQGIHEEEMCNLLAEFSY